jgi:patatin-related protein
MTSSSPTNLDYTREVRFAVVMYGGVSLAIYINGVAQELLHMVRATASDGGAKLSGTEKVYRRISHLLGDDQDGRSNADVGDEQSGLPPTRFVVDIVSGTSAGGINGVFLAKALANGQDMDSLEGLWIEQGEIQQLLNDKRSIEHPLELQDPPQSLLNSQRMYLELLKALDGMDDERMAAARSPYVDELDLFVTSTDIRGVTLPIRLADDVVYERRHRNVMHFAYSKCELTGDEDDRNDFIAENNPFLAYAARCTSAFPFAFEPMRLADMDSVLKGMPKYKGDDSFKSASKRWEKFYKDYVNASGLGSVPFPERSFNDGGVLDNKPFTYATETIGHRHADVPVDRKLIYIEPSPEHPELEMERGERPNAIQNVKAALLSLPRAETIRDDLQRVLDRNQLIHRANRIMQGVEADKEVAERTAAENMVLAEGADLEVMRWKTLGALAPHPDVDELWAKPELKDDEWSRLDLADMVKRKGQSYVAYHRLEIAETTDLLAQLLARIGGLNDESDYFLIVRGLVRAWRDSFYVEYRGDDPAKPTMNSFLVSFGLSYPIRRINFLRAKVDKLYSLDDEAHKIVAGHFKGFWDEEASLSPEQRRLFRAALLRIKPNLNEIYISLRRAGRLLRSRPSTEQLAGSANEPAKQENPVRDKIVVLFQAIRAAAASDVAAKAAATNEPRKDSPTPLFDYFLGGDGESATQLSRNQRQRLSESRLEEECTVRAKALIRDHPELRGMIDETAMMIAERVTEARQEGERLALDLLTVANTSVQEDDTTSAARACLLHYYEHYDDYDMVSFPLFYQTDVGEADVVEVIRVSPEDARSLIDEGTSGCRKLAGTAIGHFGAFLDQLWRKNDILWGRLDGAERIITALLPNHPETRRLIADAQAAIVCETTRDLGQVELHDLLVESLMRTRTGDADDEALKTLNCFLGNLKNYCAPEIKGELEARIRDAEVRDYYRKVFKDRSRLEPEPTLRTAARATTIIGDLLSGISKDYNVSDRYAGWVARLGTIFWGLVEVSVPQSVPHLLFRHWLKLLYTFEVLMIVGATIFAKPEVSQFGWTAFGVTAGVNIVAWLLGDFIKGKTPVRRLIVFLFVAVVLILALIGALKTGSFLFGWQIQNMPILAWVHQNLRDFYGWLGGYFPAAVLSAARKIVPLILGLVFVLLLWWRARD